MEYKALSELASSHTVFYHERTNRLLPQHSINATIRAFGPDGQQRWHFLDVFEDGPAHLAGIKPGEMLVAVDGTSYAPPTMPPFRIGETHKIAISSALGENSREITVSIPFRKGTKDRPPRDPHLARSAHAGVQQPTAGAFRHGSRHVGIEYQPADLIPFVPLGGEA